MIALIAGIEGALGYKIIQALNTKGWNTVQADDLKVAAEVMEESKCVDLIVAPLTMPFIRTVRDIYLKRHALQHGQRIVFCTPTLTRDAFRVGMWACAESVVTPDRIVETLLDPLPYWAR
jgi:hypothetical protein